MLGCVSTHRFYSPSGAGQQRRLERGTGGITGLERDDQQYQVRRLKTGVGDAHGDAHHLAAAAGPVDEDLVRDADGCGGAGRGIAGYGGADRPAGTARPPGQPCRHEKPACGRPLRRNSLTAAAARPRSTTSRAAYRWRRPPTTSSS